MSESVIPVDLLNPGQVFACIGLTEAADVLVGGASGGFDWSDPSGPRFRLTANGASSPVVVVLEFLASAEVCAQVPARSSDGSLTTEKWSVPTETLRDGCPFPFTLPPSPATLPATLRRGGIEISIDHWGDSTDRDNVKFWAGAGGYPGVALLRDALDLVRDRLPTATKDPFALHAAQSSSFRLDWRRDYVPLGIGFSLNRHSRITPRGYPLVEILGAIGLSHARPARPNPRDKLVYRYGVVAGDRIPLPLLRAALGGSVLPFPSRQFRVQLSWPGKEGQARCITDVIEETHA